MANNLMESSDSVFATTSTNNFPLAGTEFKSGNDNSPQKTKLMGATFADIEQNFNNQQETLKKLSDAN